MGIIVQAIQIDDTLFRALQDIWRTQEYRISSIFKHLMTQFQIKEPSTGWECLLLYGREQDGTMIEKSVGRLIAIAPGIVVVDTDEDDYLRPLSGLLVRPLPPTTYFQVLFRLRSFSRENPSLSIYPSTFPRVGGRFKFCPTYIHWEMGAGMVASYERLGIDPGRWEIMRSWLDKWLPKF